MYDVIILDFKQFSSTPPRKWVMKGPRTIYPTFQYIQSCLW